VTTAPRDRPARRSLRALRGGQACHWQALWVNDGVCGFIFYFPFDCNAKAQRKQRLERTELVRTAPNRAKPAPIETNRFGTGCGIALQCDSWIVVMRFLGRKRCEKGARKHAFISRLEKSNALVSGELRAFLIAERPIRKWRVESGAGALAVEVRVACTM